MRGGRDVESLGCGGIGGGNVGAAFGGAVDDCARPGEEGGGLVEIGVSKIRGADLVSLIRAVTASWSERSSLWILGGWAREKPEND